MKFSLHFYNPILDYLTLKNSHLYFFKTESEIQNCFCKSSSLSLPLCLFHKAAVNCRIWHSPYHHPWFSSSPYLNRDKHPTPSLKRSEWKWKSCIIMTITLPCPSLLDLPQQDTPFYFSNSNSDDCIVWLNHP